jgi:NAD(P)-dependent dehydrogenase (short-subunit alcohol dehydrogenase family)
MNLSFENKVALVTGAGAGIGLATAKAFAEAGASVALAGWNEKVVRSAAEELVARVTKRSLSIEPRMRFTTSAGVNMPRRVPRTACRGCQNVPPANCRRD